MASSKYSCSICLDLLKDPVTIPCGHSYCMTCIKVHLDGEDGRRDHRCPQCRQTFMTRPVLKKNFMLAELVEDQKKAVLQGASADHFYAGPEDVGCDICSGRKMKAVKSCLVCLVSYCENHLKPHYDVPGLKKHKLVKPIKQLQDSLCSRHDEVMKLLVDEYQTVSAAEELGEKQKELQMRRQQIQQRIQDQEKDVELLLQELEAINVSADKTVEDSEKIFTELIRLLQERRHDVKQQIRSQQETEVSQVKELQEKLEQEISELKRKDAELEQLSITEDHNQFLHNYSSLSALSESTHSSSINVPPLRYFDDVTAAVSELRDKLQEILRDTLTNISQKVTKVDVLLSYRDPEPTTRISLLKYSQEITLDPNTLNMNMLLSEGNRKVTRMNQLSYPDQPERFTDWPQVLSKESLTGRCYWEVERSEEGVVCLAVSYKNISRAGSSDECRFGFNEKSWSLLCDRKSYTFYHNSVYTPVSGPYSSRLGVFLDHRAGILSFYSLSETTTLLHRVQTRFTQPLCVGITLYISLSYPGGSSAKLIKLK